MPIASKAFHPTSAGSLSVSFDLSGKRRGLYRMRAQLMRGGKAFGTSFSRSFPYNPKPKIRFDGEGVMLVDGKPFFPIGIYNLRTRLGTPDAKVAEIRESIMKESAEAGFNSTVLYDDLTPNIMPLLDACDRYGIKAFVYPTVPFHKWKGNETPDAIRKDLSDRMKHPALLGWYVVDEPEGIGTAPSQAVRDVYQVIKEFDSDHPCGLVVMSADAASEYRAATDIMWADPYPMPDRPVTMVSEVVAGTVKNIEKDKPMWDIPQAFDWNAYRGNYDGLHRPTPDEERCLTYLALVNGAKGIIFWAHTAGKYYIQDYPEHWAAVKRIAAELRDLSPVLTVKTVDGRLTTSPSGNAIQTMLKKQNGEWYAFAVNSSSKPREASFNLLGASNVGKVDVMFEKRSLSAENGGWRDSFKPLEVHVYRVSGH